MKLWILKIMELSHTRESQLSANSKYSIMQNTRMQNTRRLVTCLFVAESGNGNDLGVFADMGNTQTLFAEAMTSRGTSTASENRGQLISLHFLQSVVCSL